MDASTKRIALTLGLLGAVGPFAIDMYLPSLPQIAEDLGTSVAATQTTLTAYFLVFGVAQLVYGPLVGPGRAAPAALCGAVDLHPGLARLHVGADDRLAGRPRAPCRASARRC